MSSVIKEYLANPNNITSKSDKFVLRKHILCNDGFIISVQASSMHYCSPKENLDDGNYTTVEIGVVDIPKEDRKMFSSYLDDFTGYGCLSPGDKVIGCCPIERVDEVIRLHSGIYKITHK